MARPLMDPHVYVFFIIRFTLAYLAIYFFYQGIKMHLNGGSIE